jgi:hypothetical protein
VAPDEETSRSGLDRGSGKVADDAALASQSTCSLEQRSLVPQCAKRRRLGFRGMPKLAQVPAFLERARCQLVNNAPLKFKNLNDGDSDDI